MQRQLLEQFRTGLVDRSLKWPSRWSVKKLIMPPPFEGPPDYRNFPWLPSILDTMEGQVTVMKGSQLGCSVVAQIKGLFVSIEQRDEAMIIQPTAQAAGIFAQSRLDPIIANSPALREAFPTNNSVALKTTKYHSHIFIRGSISEAGLTGQPVSVAIIDEFDRCNVECLPLIMQRMTARAIADRHVFVLSTPVLPGMGVDEQFKLGTQERFVFNCPSCSRGITLEWPDCVEMIGDSPNDERVWESYYKCCKCGKRLDYDLRGEENPKILTKPWLETARWEANAKVQHHRSFYIPKMYGPRTQAGELVIASMKADANESEKVQFVNQSLGLPYIMEGAKLNYEIIDSCIGPHKLTDDPPKAALDNLVCMGVDVGSMLDVVIAEYIYDKAPGFEPHFASIAKIIQIRRVPGSDWYELGNIMRAYSVDHCVIEKDPETTMARKFANEFYPGVSLAQYRKGTSQLDVKAQKLEDRVPLLTIHRTNFLDMAIGRFHKNRVIIPQDTGYVFKDHLCALTKTYEFDQNNRPVSVYVTENNRADHLAHAFVFCEVAHLRAYAKSRGRVVGSDPSVREI